jgi:hypothetical protein
LLFEHLKANFSTQVKDSTGIVGVPVEPNARHILNELYSQILRDIQILPEKLQYRLIILIIILIILFFCF